MTDQPLFDTTATEPGPAPTCPLCRLRPVMWGVRKHDWTRYCAGGHCSNPMRRCLHCQETVPLAEFRFVKYCSLDCAVEAKQSRDTVKGRFHKCLGCPNTSESTKPEPHGWRDGRCSDCWRTRVGNDRMKAMILHRVPWDLADHWAQTGWPCSLCGEPVSIKAGVIDHDHDCCPGTRSCGKCIRGYLHSNCNVALGYLKNDPALCLAAANYLENYQARR